MADDRNVLIKKYICETFVEEEPHFISAKNIAKQNDIPDIAVPENVGKLIYLLTKIHQPTRILEIGTLAGYSTLWLAKAAPNAEIITIESEPKHARIAKNNFLQANQRHKIDLIEGNALEILKNFIKDEIPPFDLIFLDADKDDYPTYLPLLLKLSQSGTLLLTDNLIPRGNAINQPASTDIHAIQTYTYNSNLASHPNIETILATTIVGENGRVDALGISLIIK